MTPQTTLSDMPPVSGTKGVIRTERDKQAATAEMLPDGIVEGSSCRHPSLRTGYANRFSHILAARLAGGALDEEDVRFLLRAEEDDAALAELMGAAREMRRRRFGNRVFLYGFVYFSTYCRNDCSFCYYGRSNDESPRYRKSLDETVELARRLADSGVHLIDLTMGEDPEFLSDPLALPTLVSMVRKATGLPIMVSPGVIDDGLMGQVARRGADWYALYQETFVPSLFGRLRVEQVAESRMAAKRSARRFGLLVEEGLMCGLGESREDILVSLMAMRELDAAQVRVMTFVPQHGTPLGGREQVSYRRELLIIALMRLLFPDRLIPASLDVEGVSGLERRLAAGANVVTSIIPPEGGLAGVASAYTDIADGNRTVRGLRAGLRHAGLEVATADEYRSWVESRRCR